MSKHQITFESMYYCTYYIYWKLSCFPMQNSAAAGTFRDETFNPIGKVKCGICNAQISTQSQFKVLQGSWSTITHVTMSQKTKKNSTKNHSVICIKIWSVSHRNQHSILELCACAEWQSLLPSDTKSSTIVVKVAIVMTTLPRSHTAQLSSDVKIAG